MNSITADNKSSWTVRLTENMPAAVILALLFFIIASGTGENIHSRLLALGTYIWEDYFILRGDIPTPECNPNINVETRVNELERKFNAETDEFDLFAETFNRDATTRSVRRQLEVCQEKHVIAKQNQEKVTTAVIAFRNVEAVFSEIALFAVNNARTVLLLLIFFAAAVTTIQKHHIAFRPIVSTMDYRVSITAQLIGHLALTISAWKYREILYASGVEVQHPQVTLLMIAGFGTLSLISLYQFLFMPKDLEQGGSPVHALLSVPIYMYMVLIAANYFIIDEGHAAGLTILFSQMIELAGLYLKFALFIWVGMLLKQTRLGERVFDIFKPWHLPPEVLAFLAVVVMAVPTAYTGASGIIIIAMGVVVYQELRRIGTRRQLALATTAMTGSSGVVLRPCLLVIGIAMLNKEVVSDELFYYGKWVFLLTVAMFFFFAMLTKKEKLEIAPAREALGPSLAMFKPLLPYIGIMFAIGVAYAVILDAYLDEFSAPIILPIMVIGLIMYERYFDKSEPQYEDPERGDTVRNSLTNSIKTSSVHIGALLVLMGASFTVGGVIEQAGMVPEFPESFNSLFGTMLFMVLFLVFIGMIMDPFGALILVSSTVAPVAYAQGIDPIHFWMVCLVAFELGYLSPPVSLNHLLTRQVVGEEEARLAAQEGDTFYYRHEKILLPLMVMGSTLLIVAFIPLFFLS